MKYIETAGINRLLKQNARHKFIILAYLLLLYGIHLFVFMYGDDYMYGSFAHNHLLTRNWEYYFTGNGRLWINISTSALLFFDRYLYIAVNPLLILAFIHLLVCNIRLLVLNDLEAGEKDGYFLWGIALFSTMDILCLRETVFWITGMMNYLLPASLFLLGILLFQYERKGHLNRKSQYITYVVVTILISSSVEQYALMFVGVVTLITIFDVVKKEIINRRRWILYVISILSLASLVLAPGNFVRIDGYKEVMPSLIDNLWTLVYQNTASDAAFPYLVMISLGCLFLLNNKELTDNTFTRILCCSPLALLLLIKTVPGFEKAVLILLYLIVFFAQLLHVFIFRKYQNKEWILSWAFVGVGSQVMLLVSTVWGFRCMLSLYVIYMLLILYLLMHVKKQQAEFILLSGLLSSVSPVLCIVFWLIVGGMRIKKKNLLCFEKMQSIGICLLVLFVCCVLIYGYSQNAPVHQENIKSASRLDGADVVYVSKMNDKIYSWAYVPLTEVHEEYYRSYFNIPSNIEIEYITEHTESSEGK